MRLFTACAATLLLILTACQKVPPEDMTALELRTYDVPKGTVRPLRSAIKDALWLNENQRNVGRAVVTPDGRLAVLATRSVQAGVKALVDEVAKNPPTLEQTIELRYWLLVGHPAPAPQPPLAELAEIQPALTEISRSQGPQTFSVVQRVRLSSLNDERARVEAGKLKVEQLAVETTDGVFAEIEINQFDNNDKVVTRVRLAADQIVVLGATGGHAGDASDGATLYYIVRLAPRTADGQRP